MQTLTVSISRRQAQSIFRACGKDGELVERGHIPTGQAYVARNALGMVSLSLNFGPNVKATHTDVGPESVIPRRTEDEVFDTLLAQALGLREPVNGAAHQNRRRLTS